LHRNGPPLTASVIASLDHEWHDEPWMRRRKDANALSAPMSIYEVHLGSWRRDPASPDRILSCGEIADPLADYAVDMGFTHVELMPVTEHPFYGSWGYQTTGYFAPSARYGTPADFMKLVDRLHARGVGVILDWVPSHFPSDEHGLVYFDGTHLYEHADPRQGFHPEWNSCIFNYSRNEVRGFLMSSAMFWLDRYHIDGIRVDAVASMLYLDYARKPGEWIPNEYGGRENLAAVSFLRQLNDAVAASYPDVRTIAEESTAWPKVSRPTRDGGLGFDLKWNMGWMNDTLAYFKRETIHRRFHQDQIRFSLWYAWNENFVLPLSHDEVVHLKGSLCARCRATIGSASPTCGSSSGTCGGIRARSSCSWAASSRNGASGTTTRASTGICFRSPNTPACRRGCGTSIACSRARPRCTPWTSQRKASRGCRTPTMPTA
jgi:1,4-alpha-glucan branching enzyme